MKAISKKSFASTLNVFVSLLFSENNWFIKTLLGKKSF